MAWRIEVSQRTELLSWSLLRIDGFDTEYAEKERRAAVAAVTNLARIFPTLMFRVIHKHSPRRGAFYPTPRPARGAA